MARALDLSPARVNAMVAQGMPMDSAQAAEAWRAANVALKMSPAQTAADPDAETEERDPHADYTDAVGDAMRFAQSDVERYLPLVRYLFYRAPLEQFELKPPEADDGIPDSFIEML